MSLFRAKAGVPYVIEARQVLDELHTHAQIALWIETNGGEAFLPFVDPYITVGTPDGLQKAEIGSWIVRYGTEFRVMAADDFEAAYASAERAS